MKHEKALLALPVSPCPDLNQKPKEKIDKYKSREFVRYCAEIIPFEDGDVLAFTTYTDKGKAQYRFFQNASQYGMQVFETDAYAWHKERVPGRLYECAVDYQYPSLNRGWWSDYVIEAYSTEENMRAAYRFFGKQPDAGNPLDLLAQQQQSIRKAKINVRDEKKRAALREAFQGVDKEIPNEFKEWAEEVPLRSSRYFFYDYTGKKLQSGVCSHCMKRTELPGIREWDTGVCPNCGTEFTFYSAKRLFRSHGISCRTKGAFLVPVNDDRVAFRLCTVGIQLRGGLLENLEKNVWACENSRFFINGKGELCDTYCNPEGTTKVYVDNLARCDCVHGDVQYIAPMHLEEVRKRMKIYAPLETLAEHGLIAFPPTLFKSAMKRPQIEYLIKMGLYGLATNELAAHDRQPVLEDGTKAHEVLNVLPDLIPLLKKADPSARAFLTIRILHKNGIKLTPEDMHDIDRLNIGWRNSTRVSDMADASSIHKALKYIKEQARICGNDGDHVCQEWGDYCGMAKKIGINLGDHCALFPKNLKAAHAEAVKIQENQKNEKLNKQMGITAAKLQDLCWQFNGLVVRPAINQGELFEEGKMLSHCVGRICYAEKQAKGSTAIFFIRKIKTPDVSYVTLELDLKKWEKIQCYAKHDAYPGAQVNDFVKRWIEEIVKPSRDPAYARNRISNAV